MTGTTDGWASDDFLGPPITCPDCGTVTDGDVCRQCGTSTARAVDPAVSRQWRELNELDIPDIG